MWGSLTVDHRRAVPRHRGRFCGTGHVWARVQRKVEMRAKKMPKDFVIPEDLDPVYNYPLPPLTEFLDTKKGIQYFGLYLSDCKCEENLAFYCAARDFKANFADYKDGEAQKEFQRIWKAFIDPSELTCINIPAEVEEAITKHKDAKTVTETIFDGPRNHALTLMFNSYGKFRRTTYFENWLRYAEKKKGKELRNKWYKEFGHLEKDQWPKPSNPKLLPKPERK